MKNKKLKLTIILTKKEDMIKSPDFEQNYYSRTSVGFYKIRYESLRLLKWLFQYDRCFFENRNFF